MTVKYLQQQQQQQQQEEEETMSLEWKFLKILLETGNGN